MEIIPSNDEWRIAAKLRKVIAARCGFRELAGLKDQDTT
jgi:hypothetical protein